MAKRAKKELQTFTAKQLLLCEATLVTKAENIEEAKQKFKRGDCSTWNVGHVIFEASPSDVALLEEEKK